MKDFRHIIELLKEEIAAKSGLKQRVYDKDVAQLLRIPQSKFATIKKRNSMPYRELLHYCHHEEKCCLELFFD